MPDGVSAPHSETPAPVLPLYAEVIIPRHVARTFTYLIPAGLQNRTRIGSRVLVPFGRSSLQGVVVAVTDRPSAESALKRLREIRSLLDDNGNELSPELLELSRLIAERYLAPWGQCVRLVLPPTQPRRREDKYVLTDAGRRALSGAERLSAADRELLHRLARRAKGLTEASLRNAAGTSFKQALRRISRKGWVHKQDAEQHGPGAGTKRQAVVADERGELDPRPIVWGLDPKDVSPEALDRLIGLCDAPRHVAVLLHAPPEYRLACLLRVAEAMLARRLAVLVVTGEVLRAGQVAHQAKSRWGDRVVLVHSGLPAAVRAEGWRRIRAGTASVVIGTRSAVFAPVSSPGLVWIDGEEDASLKEEQEPRYHARDVAWIRASRGRALLVLGSSHPSLETMQAIERDGGALYLALTAPGQPRVELVDLRTYPSGTLLSPPMVEGIDRALAQRNRVALFLNRKGYARALTCRDCGSVPRCEHCSVSLAYYRRIGRLICQYCGVSVALPDTCTSCRAARLEPVGFGTERLEDEVRRFFPKARIARLDRDVIRRTSQVEAVRRMLGAGELDLIIGTQLLFQLGPPPLFGFVGVPYADAGLHLPDFRAAERTYHALLDAMRLACPDEAGGRVVLQTYLPTHHAVAAVVDRDFQMFVKTELAVRETLGYPPFYHLIGLRVSGRNAERAETAAVRWGELLREQARRAGRQSAHGAMVLSPAEGPACIRRETDGVGVLGPVPAPVAKVRGRYRWHLLVKSTDREFARALVGATLERVEEERTSKDLKFEVDVDPVEAL
ncbi:MAG TPA: primosomal protein N' [Chloroflexota bacterium]|jgi:primosomal protein N' (replication factor Y)|nr:primosomal protein N' [Chloroflexota bacterium]